LEIKIEVAFEECFKTEWTINWKEYNVQCIAGDVKIHQKYLKVT